MWKLTIYRDRRGQWRWRIKARNGRIIAESGEGYVSKFNARRAAERIKNAIDSWVLVRTLEVR